MPYVNNNGRSRLTYRSALPLQCLLSQFQLINKTFHQCIASESIDLLIPQPFNLRTSYLRFMRKRGVPMNPTFVAFRFTSYSLRRSTTSSIIPRLRQQRHNSAFRPFRESRNFSTARYKLNKMTSTSSEETLEELCTRVQTIVPEQFQKDAWYLIVVRNSPPFISTITKEMARQQLWSAAINPPKQEHSTQTS